MNGQNHDKDSTSQHDVEGVDSTATTLLGSPASAVVGTATTSIDYAAGEYTRHRQDDKKEHDLEYDTSEDEDGFTGEGEHLLAGDITATIDTNITHSANVDDLDPQPPSQPKADSKSNPVSWSSLPQKRQLAILTLSRLSEPLASTSLQSYIFYQLKTFHAPGASPPTDATVATQAGILAAAFTGAQMCTAVLWGRAADSERMGRKKVILVGLLGTSIGVLGFGFSSSFAQAVVWRAIGGALNGNIGVMRTMISEIVREKRFQSRAFLLLPMTFNVGVIIGPLLGGLLADPVGSYPWLFGKEYGGWLRMWPYALPSVVCAAFLSFSALGVILGLEETLEGLQGKPDYGLRFSSWVARTFGWSKRRSQEYQSLAAHEHAVQDFEMSAPHHSRQPSAIKKQKLPLSRIWTPNVVLTLLAHGCLAAHVGCFNNLWFVFLSTPRYTARSKNNDGDSTTIHLPKGYTPHAPFTFTGGLALPPPSIGTALAILGVIGISMQLLLYPRVSWRLGTVRSYRYSLLLFPISYTLAPYLAVIPSSSPAPHPASGGWIWTAITFLLLIQVTARTFSLPATAILVNNSCPHPSVLGTVHGIAQTVSSAARTVGPVLVGWGYGRGLEKGVVGAAWWGLAIWAVLGVVVGRWVREGSGHEIFLEGEVEEGKG
ncbi:hypothetical protein LTR78_001857 [Recurvomyces mirabilis]|uniref:Major facilitator superfamily (MFS) profile domain-containing protein n=1 Tax=Recurvomyces mirabilis TaxID=574656 RepID=A0AAE1C5B0_9PEZI|nr:hypothetical protein LTR78_001857 [Recurvomyces mirabilis]KAK5156703.1 hypothetical protein LTS14_004915 [Recurvomyces mirabilis]